MSYKKIEDIRFPPRRLFTAPTYPKEVSDEIIENVAEGIKEKGSEIGIEMKNIKRESESGRIKKARIESKDGDIEAAVTYSPALEGDKKVKVDDITAEVYLNDEVLGEEEYSEFKNTVHSKLYEN